MKKDFRVVALLTVRNEEAYIDRCIRHLHAQGIEVCLIDNGSTDRTLEIARTLTHLGIIRFETQVYRGMFSLEDQCRLQERLSRDIEADWFIHHDADEIRQSDQPNQSLRDAIAEIDHDGFNAVNFHEFVFVPTCDEEACEHGDDYVSKIRNYYFFSPRPRHRINAWKNIAGTDVDLVGSGGHDVQFDGRRVAERNLILRHYIVLSAEHAHEKYGSGRIFAPGELSDRGWHRGRDTWKTMQFTFPDSSGLVRYADNGGFDTSDPKQAHVFWR